LAACAIFGLEQFRRCAELCYLAPECVEGPVHPTLSSETKAGSDAAVAPGAPDSLAGDFFRFVSGPLVHCG
jgi:hypothetical protein